VGAKRVLVVCGTGFIGAHVVRALHARGHEVTVLHRGRHEPDLPPGVRHVRSELASIPVLAFPDALRATELDVVVHMVPIGEADARAAVETFRGRAGRLVAVSSGDVYAAYGQLIGAEPAQAGSAPAGLLDEDAPLRQALYPYGRSVPGPWGGELHDYDKILVERVVLGDSELPGTVLRLPKVYGPGDGQHHFLPYLKRMDDRRPVILLGHRQAGWRWTHGYVEDVGAAVALAVTDDRAAGRVYNVGEAHTPTLEARVRALGRAAGWTGEVVRLPDERLPAHLRGPLRYDVDLACDSARVRGELGYVEAVADDEALRRTIAWERSAAAATDPAAYDYAAEDAALRAGQ
jgi:nucleoside-diphosphate-sugar epimerase